jgi:hypothetical protein
MRSLMNCYRSVEFISDRQDRSNFERTLQLRVQGLRPLRHHARETLSGCAPSAGIPWCGTPSRGRKSFVAKSIAAIRNGSRSGRSGYPTGSRAVVGIR